MGKTTATNRLGVLQDLSEFPDLEHKTRDKGLTDPHCRETSVLFYFILSVFMP